jgi:hypothetical protein
VARPGQGSIALLLCGAALLASGCVTRPSLRGWSVGPVEDGYRLAYGLRNSGRPDFAVICDLSAGVADLVYRAGPAPGVVQGARTELLIGVGEQVDALPAEVGDVDARGATIVARTRLPPTPVAEWVGKRLTVGALGTASTFLVRPSRAQIRTFLSSCAGDWAGPKPGRF